MSTHELTERASVASTPPTGRWKLYFKSGGMYILDDAGVEYLVTAGQEGVFDYVQLVTTAGVPTHTEGRLYWDNTAKTLAIQTGETDVTLQVNQEQVFRGINKTGDDLNNGTVTYVSGAQGQRPSVAKAKADADATALGTIGFTTHLISDNAVGYITTFGLVRDLDTSSCSAGDEIYLSATTAGAFTNISPAKPLHQVTVGYCIVSHPTDGVILARIHRTAFLSELRDVSITGLADGDHLEYDASDGLWKNHASFRGSAYVSSAGATGSITPGSPVNLLVNSTIAEAATPKSFTVDNTNKRLTYTGTETRAFEVSAIVSMIASANNIVTKFYIAKNGTVITGSEQNRKVGTGTDVGNASVEWEVELTENDYVEVWVDVSGASTVTPQKCFFKAHVL